MTDLLARHQFLLVYLTAAAGALALWASSVLIRLAKAGGARWDSRSEQERERLSMLPGIAVAFVVVGVCIVSGLL